MSTVTQKIYKRATAEATKFWTGCCLIKHLYPKTTNQSCCYEQIFSFFLLEINVTKPVFLTVTVLTLPHIR